MFIHIKIFWMPQLNSFIIFIDNSREWHNDSNDARLERWKISTFSSGDFPRTRFSVVFLLSLDFYLCVVFTVAIFLSSLEMIKFCFFRSVIVECVLLLSVKGSSLTSNNWFSQNSGFTVAVSSEIPDLRSSLYRMFS